jgi:hypothetical protein
VIKLDVLDFGGANTFDFRSDFGHKLTLSGIFDLTTYWYAKPFTGTLYGSAT